MRRYKLKNKKRFLGIVVITAFIVSLGLTALLYHPKAEGATLSSYKTVTVNYGDTLWEIAQRYGEHSGKDMRMVVYNIEKVNELEGEMIMPGQVLRIPQGE